MPRRRSESGLSSEAATTRAAEARSAVVVAIPERRSSLWEPQETAQRLSAPPESLPRRAVEPARPTEAARAQSLRRPQLSRVQACHELQGATAAARRLPEKTIWSKRRLRPHRVLVSLRSSAGSRRWDFPSAIASGAEDYGLQLREIPAIEGIPPPWPPPPLFRPNDVRN